MRRSLSAQGRRRRRRFARRRTRRASARVIATDIFEVRLQELTAEFPNLDLVPVAADIASADAVHAIMTAAGGRVDALANVAGIMDSFLPPAEVDDATWQRVLDVNLTAVMRLTRAVLPLMIEAGSGAIVNVSSEASLRASASGAAYTASKHALNGYTKSVAVFYKGNGVRCNAVAPGAVLTNIRGTLQVSARGCGTRPATTDKRPRPCPVRGFWRPPSHTC